MTTFIKLIQKNEDMEERNLQSIISGVYYTRWWCVCDVVVLVMITVPMLIIVIINCLRIEVIIWQGNGTSLKLFWFWSLLPMALKLSGVPFSVVKWGWKKEGRNDPTFQIVWNSVRFQRKGLGIRALFCPTLIPNPIPWRGTEFYTCRIIFSFLFPSCNNLFTSDNGATD